MHIRGTAHKGRYTCHEVNMYEKWLSHGLWGYDSILQAILRGCDSNFHRLVIITSTYSWKQGRIEHPRAPRYIWGWRMESGLVWSWIFWFFLIFNVIFNLFVGKLYRFLTFCNLSLGSMKWFITRIFKKWERVCLRFRQFCCQTRPYACKKIIHQFFYPY